MTSNKFRRLMGVFFLLTDFHLPRRFVLSGVSCMRSLEGYYSPVDGRLTGVGVLTMTGGDNGGGHVDRPP